MHSAVQYLSMTNTAAQTKITLYSADGKPETVDAAVFGAMPEGAIALKYNDEVDGARWITDDAELAKLRRESAPLSLVAKSYIWRLERSECGSDDAFDKAVEIGDGGTFYAVLADGTDYAGGERIEIESAPDSVSWGDVHTIYGDRGEVVAVEQRGEQQESAR